MGDLTRTDQIQETHEIVHDDQITTLFTHHRTVKYLNNSNNLTGKRKEREGKLIQ